MPWRTENWATLSGMVLVGFEPGRRLGRVFCADDAAAAAALQATLITPSSRGGGGYRRGRWGRPGRCSRAARRLASPDSPVEAPNPLVLAMTHGRALAKALESASGGSRGCFWPAPRDCVEALERPLPCALRVSAGRHGCGVGTQGLGDAGVADRPDRRGVELRDRSGRPVTVPRGRGPGHAPGPRCRGA